MTLLSPSHIQLIHVTLLESPEFSFELCPTLNPATLIPHSSEPPTHTCKEALEDLMPHFSHISSIPLNNPDFTWYIDGTPLPHQKEKRQLDVPLSLTPKLLNPNLASREPLPKRQYLLH